MDDVSSLLTTEDKNLALHLINEDLISRLVTWVPVGAMLVDNDGLILHSNKEIETTLGYATQEIKNTNISRLIPESVRPTHKSFMDKFYQNPQKRQMGSGRDLYALHCDGRKLPIEIGLNPIKISDRTLVLLTLIDISPRVQADRILKQSVVSASHGVLIVNQSGKIKLANQSLCRSFGYDEHELLGQNIEVLLPERYREHHLDLRKSYQKSPSMRSMGAGRDLTALHKGGREFPVEIGLSPIQDTGSNHLVQVTVLDITARKRMEQALRETNTNLEEFTYVASHDLRSPLRGISDLLEWIDEDIEAKDMTAVNKNIDRIRIRVSRLEKLIENLLTYAKSGQSSADITEVKIRELFKDIISVVDIPPNFKLLSNANLNSIECSRTPLETILRNLLSNSVKHHDKDSGVISISCETEGNYCVFAVSDDGPGIPEAALERVFRLFQTVTSSERKGSGIGLSVSRRLAEAHGGKVKAFPNTPKRGTTFKLWWPRFVRTDTYD